MARKKTPEERRKEWEEADRKAAQTWKEAEARMDALLAAFAAPDLGMANAKDMRLALEISKEALSWLKHSANLEGLYEDDENYEEMKAELGLAELGLAEKIRSFAFA